MSVRRLARRSRFVPLCVLAVVALPVVPLAADDELGGTDLTLSAGHTGASSSSGGLSLVGGEIAALEAVTLSPAASLAPELAPIALGDSGAGGSSYVELRAGPIWFLEDVEALDDAGVITELAFGYRVMPFLAVEFQPGFIWGEDEASTSELWAVPIAANAKVTIPVLIFEVYAGAGIGGYWMHTELGAAEEDDVVFGLSGFVGFNFTLGPLLVGAEGKYIWTDEFDAVGGATPNFEGFALMAQAGLSF